MSAWLIGLGLAAGYLINKNLQMSTQLNNSIAQFEDSGAEPSTDGVTSAEVRKAYTRTDFVKYGDMNSDLPKRQMELLSAGEERHASEVQDYDQQGAAGPILGVMLQYDHLGV